MSAALASACGGLIALLTAYAAGHWLLALAFLLRRRPTPVGDRPEDGVTVLIPARNEGDGALRVLTSLLNQDHAGPVHAVLLINDAADTSVPFLRAAFPQADLDHGPLVELLATPNRRVCVAYTGSDPKHSKVNWMQPWVATPYTAILDCDHQAHGEWLRSAVSRLRAGGARAIQGARFPLEATGLFGLWDSLHQHIGCELYNAAFTRLGLPVFLTGTTLVLETPLLQANPLRDCLTEDTDLSYRLRVQGVHIIADPLGGSDEDVSPDLRSFFARRRRWANGHTEAFLRQARALWRAPLPWRARVQIAWHGLHYGMAAVVFLLHLGLGLLVAPHLGPTGLVGSGLVALGLGAWAARTQRSKKKRAFASDIVVLTAWLWPAAVLAANAALALVLTDPARLSLPLPDWQLALGLAGLLTPLGLILLGLAGFGQLTWSTLATVVLTYPVAFYLDLSGVLIGLVDLISGRRLWFKVARTAHAALAAPRLGAALVPTVSIRQSWRPAAVAWRAMKGVWMSRPRLADPRTWLRWGVPLLALAGLWGWARSTRLPQVVADCQPLEHDDYPWIAALDLLGGHGYCDAAPRQPAAQWTRRAGRFELAWRDDLTAVDPARWDTLSDTFDCNLAHFRPANVRPGPQGLTLALTADAVGEKAYSAGSIATKGGWTDHAVHFGRVEATLKPARGPGIITALFLYRFDPWQEIDLEFLGRDTTKIMLNVYYNPGEPGATYNYGYRGTPVLVDLGFDAADDFHTYALEWDTDEIRWFVDDRLIHHRPAGRPTPVPHLPMRLHLNVWPICSKELAGEVDPARLPSQAQFRSVAVYRRVAQPLHRVFGWLDPAPDRGEVWQDHAGWVRRGPAAPK